MLFSYPAIAANPSGCELVSVGCVADQFGVSDYGDWVPPKGRILYFGGQRMFQIDLYFDQTAVDFYQSNPWAGFEIDIIPRNGILSMIQASSVYSNNPDSKPMRDTIVGDWNSGTRGITITNPSAISEGWVSFSFVLKGNPLIGTTIRANIQLVANALDPTFVDRLWDNNSWWWFARQYWSKWFPVAIDGNMFAYAMLGGGEKVFSFFAMANAEQAVEIDVDNNKLPFKINGDIDGEGMYWTERGNINIFATKCDIYDSQTALNLPILLPSVHDVNVGFVQELMQDALDQLSSNNNSITQIFTQGNHTHIIAPDYRCSKETNGPILCWESGRDTNCWDAWKWYQFNGDVYEVAEHRNDSNWITTLDRDYTCSQVYNSGDSGGGGNSGPGYDDDTDGDTWAGYAHHVGLKYMKIGKKSSGHWHGSRTWTAGEIPSKRDFRVKLKRKGGVWVDEACAEVWFSHNKNFTSSDLYLKKKCKDLSDETEDERSIYIKDVHLPAMEAGKNYYFFTRVTYSGGVNPSSDDDSDEYVKVEVVENPNSSEDSGTSRDNLSDAKKAAIIHMILTD